MGDQRRGLPQFVGWQYFVESCFALAPACFAALAPDERPLVESCFALAPDERPLVESCFALALDGRPLVESCFDLALVVVAVLAPAVHSQDFAVARNFAANEQLVLEL